MSDIIIDSDSGKFKAGDGQDLNLYHNGTNSFVENETGIFYVTNKANANMVLGTNNTARVTIEADGAVDMASTLAVGGNVTLNQSSSASRNIVGDRTDAQFTITGGSSGAGVQLFGSTYTNYAGALYLDATASSTGTNDATKIMRTGSSPTEALKLDRSQDATFASWITVTEGLIVNESGGDNDVRMESQNNDNMFRLDASTDRIGIGTSSPDATLVVAGAFQGNASDTILNTQGVHIDDTTAWSSLHANKPSGGGINFSGVYNSSNAQIIFGGIRGLKENNTDGNYDGALVLGTIANGGNMTEKMRITSAGLVGIGTSAPGALLDIAATSNDDYPLKIRGNIDNDGGFTGIKFGYEADTGSYEKCAIKVEGTSGNVTPDFHILLNDTANSSDVSTDNTDSRLMIANDRDVHWNGKLSNPSASNGAFGGMTFIQNSVDRFMIFMGSSSDSNNIDLIRFFAPAGSGSDVGSISTSGNQTNFETSSDYRLKENEVPLADGLVKLNKLKPYNFNWKIKSDEVVDGFFAHEVQEIVPFAVSGEKDRMETLKYEEPDNIPEGKNIGDEYEVVHPQKLDHSKLVPLLVKAVQELSAKVEALENA